MATFLEMAYHSADHMFPCILTISNANCFPFGFEGGI